MPGHASDGGVTRALQRARALDAISGRDGRICGVAIDHRDAFRAALARRGLRAVDDRSIGQFKVRIARVLAPDATVMLLDVETGAGPVIAAGAIPGGTAFAMPMEAQGYGAPHAITETTLLADWSPAQARALGASACKLLLPYRPDNIAQAIRQRAVAASCARACAETGLVLILEPIVYQVPGAELAPPRIGELIIHAAVELSALKPGVLKVQYPGSADMCRALDAACGSETPWVLLGGGADAQVLLEQVTDACQSGASGFVVGRTLFDAALVEDAAHSQRVLVEESLPLLRELNAIAREHATPWRERVGAIPVPPPGWHGDQGGGTV